jgi:hypothetical protein
MKSLSITLVFFCFSVVAYSQKLPVPKSLQHFYIPETPAYLNSGRTPVTLSYPMHSMKGVIPPVKIPCFVPQMGNVTPIPDLLVMEITPVAIPNALMK